jgi:hypothetical protein
MLGVDPLTPLALNIPKDTIVLGVQLELYLLYFLVALVTGDFYQKTLRFEVVFYVFKVYHKATSLVGTLDHPVLASKVHMSLKNIIIYYFFTPFVKTPDLNTIELLLKHPMDLSNF